MLSDFSTPSARETNINKIFILFYCSTLDNIRKRVYIIGVNVST